MKPLRIEKEKRVVEKMIRLYCKQKGHHPVLCAECAELLSYAFDRLDRCRYGEEKPTCRQCPTHCYKSSMRQQMKAVMRYSGPRMLIYAPIDGVRHWWKEWRRTNRG